MLRYGRRSWSLWGKKIHWADCKEALASIGGVAQDVIDRLQAEFHDQDLYMAYRAFDLDGWAKVISASAPDASRSRLEAAVRKMGAALGATTDWHTWRVAARLAINSRGRLNVSASTLDTNFEYRLAWRAAMLAAGFPESLARVVHFYLATWDGTGAVERGLGQDAAIQKQHVGQRAREEHDADLYSGLLELHLDGPQAESDMFTSTDGILLLTDFSRACAQQWVLHHGRRFTCYKVRKDKASRRPGRKKGTDRAVQLLARAAYKTQCDMAKADGARASTPGREPARRTVFGVERAKLMATVRRLATPAAGKKTQRFRDATLAKRAEKEAAETWCGWGSNVPKPRLGGAAAVEAATRSAATQAVRGKLWLSGRSRVAARETRLAGASTPGSSKVTAKTEAVKKGQVPKSHDVPVNTGTWKRHETSPTKASNAGASTGTGTTAASSMLGVRPKPTSASTLGATQPSAFMYKAVAAKFAKRHHHVIDTSLETMVKQRLIPDSTVVSSWLKAVAQGGLVTCAGKRMALQPGIHTGCHVQLNPTFVHKHGSLADAMRKAAKDSKGKWVLDSHKPAKNAHHIAKMRDMVAFLLHARRVAAGSEGSALVRSF